MVLTVCQQVSDKNSTKALFRPKYDNSLQQPGSCDRGIARKYCLEVGYLGVATMDGIARNLSCDRGVARNMDRVKGLQKLVQLEREATRLQKARG
jgi:hypothetical protein